MSGIGSNLFWHVLESTILGLVFIGSVRAIGIRSSSALCWIYRLGLLKFAVPTVWLFGLVKSGIAGASSNEAIVVFGPLQNVARSVAVLSEVGGPIQEASLGGFSLLLIGGVLLAMGAMGSIGWRLVSGTRFHWRTRNTEKPFGAREARVLKSCMRNDLRIDGSLVEAGPGIGLYGIFRPRIIARRAFFDSLSDEELATAIQHEVAHRIRRDNLWCIVTEVVACLFWFNPMVWELRKRMLFEMEKACDEQVIFEKGNPSGYAKCLLKAAAFSSQGEIVGAVALSESYLKRRVRNVIEYQYIKLSKMKLFFINVVGGMLLLGTFAISAFADASANNPLEDVRSDSLDEERLILVDRNEERLIEAHVDEKAEKRLAEMERQMKRIQEIAAADMERLVKTLRGKEREMEKMQMRLLQEKEDLLAQTQEMRADAMVQVERATEALADQREKFAKEKAEFQRRERYTEYRDELSDDRTYEDRRAEDRDEEGHSDLRYDDRRYSEENDEDSKVYELKDFKVYDLKELDKLPRASYQIEPIYPPELKRKGIEGWAQIEWVITDKGAVREARIIGSSRKAFEEPAIEAIMKSKWIAGRKGGKAINVRVRQKMDFKTKKSDSGSNPRERF